MCPLSSELDLEVKDLRQELLKAVDEHAQVAARLEEAAGAPCTDRTLQMHSMWRAKPVPVRTKQQLHPSLILWQCTFTASKIPCMSWISMWCCGQEHAPCDARVPCS